MTGMIFSSLCFIMSIYQMFHGSDTGTIIFMIASGVWYLLGMVYTMLIQRNERIKDYITKFGGIKE